MMRNNIIYLFYLIVFIFLFLNSEDVFAKRTNACQLAKAGYWVKFSIRTCEKHANEGDVFSQFLLGNIYYVGKIVPRDLEKSLKFYKMAANNRNIDSYMRLGEFYMLGGVVHQNYQHAYVLFSLVDKLGDPRGRANVERIEKLHLAEADKEEVMRRAESSLKRLMAGESAINWDITPISNITR